MGSKDIVLLSTADWDNPFWTNKQHVAVELSRIGNRVFYIDSLGLRRPSASVRDLRRIVKRLYKAISPPRKVRDNLWVWSPIVLPWHNNPYIRLINRMLIGSGLWVWLKYLGLKKQWLWTYNPLTTEFFSLKSFSRKIYHCVDEIKAQPGMPVELLESGERKLSSAASIIFTTSNQLTVTRRAWNANTHYLPNVADYAHFGSAMDSKTIIPADLNKIKEPRIGFIGAISGYKIDFELIRYIANSRPSWSIVLIGEIGEGDPWTDSTVLQGLPNLHLLGPRAYQTLPSYLKGFDAALLPNKVNEYTDAMFPMKFFEYLAAGRPVVSVKLKALQEYAAAVSTAATPEEFVAAIEQTLAGNCATLDQRLKVAQINTYQTRTQRMIELIDK